MNGAKLKGLLMAGGVLVLGEMSVARGEEELEEAVGAIAAEWVNSEKTAGLSIGVAKGGEVLLAEGYGSANLELEVSASAESVYRIGSVTKQFTAAAILLLVEEGTVGLGDSLSQWLPDFDMQGHEVTVLQLLQHTSGIRSMTSLPTFREQVREDAGREEMLALIEAEPFDFPPGRRFKYNNSGYYLLGVIIEEASGKTYGQFLRERIFEPLGMESTRVGGWRPLIENRASGYARWGVYFLNAEPISMTQPFAAGALVSTVGDLMKWQRGLVEGKVLSEASWERMTTRGITNKGDEIPYGCGVFVQRAEGQPVIRHGGGIKGFRSELNYFPESDVTIVVLANTENVAVNEIVEAVAGVVLRE
ncbi:MAG: serine hydrolase domain-containing protein [Verrucomicrobiota bacterium]